MRYVTDRWIKWTLPVLVYALVGTGLAFGQAQGIALGGQMPVIDYVAVNANGGEASLGGLKGSAGTAVVFWSNQCPWVDKYQDRVRALVGDFGGRGVSFVFVNSNDAAAYPQESAAASANRVSGAAYLMDADSQIARAFGAERTPQVYLFDASGALVYVGSVDDSPGDPANVQKSYLRDALTALAGGSPVAVPETKAFGCMIKFKN